MNVRTMLSILSGAGVEVDLLTYPLGEETPMEGLRVFRVPRPPLMKVVPIGPSWKKIVLDMEMLPAAYRLARRGGYSLVHAVEESVYIGLLLKKRFGLPLIYDMDSSLKDQLAHYGFGRLRAVSAFISAMEKAAIKGSDAAITVCRSLTDIVIELDPDKTVFQIEDIPLQVDTHSFPPDEDDLEAFFAGKDVLLYTGNFENYQGVSLLLESMPLVLKDRPEALLVLVGGSGKSLQEIRALSGRLGVDGSVLTLDPRPPSEMDWFMKRAAVLLSPRLKGTNTPLKIYTYMESGRPVVATRLMTHTQVLEDDSSVLVEPDAGSMARGIVRLLNDPDLASRLGSRGRDVVRERYSLEVFRRKLLEAYRHLGGYKT
jgi:glycosyltransferase involved in cell wall biosynthesis